MNVKAYFYIECVNLLKERNISQAWLLKHFSPLSKIGCEVQLGQPVPQNITDHLTIETDKSFILKCYSIFRRRGTELPHDYLLIANP